MALRHSRDFARCFRPGFFTDGGGGDRDAPRRFSLQQPAPCCGGRATCCFLLVVCGWVALPLTCEFALRQNGWLAAYDAASLLAAAQASVPSLDVRVVDGHASWVLPPGERDPRAPPSAQTAPRAEFPRPYYQLFEPPLPGKGDVISTYLFDAAMAAMLRWLDPDWGDDSYNFQVATPVEFIDAELVEARQHGSLTWDPAVIASIEHSTKLNKFNYTIKWVNDTTETSELEATGGSSTPVDEKCDAEDSETAPGTETDGSSPASELVSELISPGTIFTGLYNCGRRKTSFKVEIQEHRDFADSELNASGQVDPRIAVSRPGPHPVYAEFSFQHDQENSTGCNGSFGMVGELSSSNRLELLPEGEFGSQTDGWSANPCNYSSIALLGQIDPVAESFSGDVLDVFDACTDFAGFVRPPAVSFPAAVVGDWWGSDNSARTLTLEISSRGARMELTDSASTDYNATGTAAVTKDILQRVISAAIDSVSVYSGDETGTGDDESQLQDSPQAGAGEGVGAALLGSLATALSKLEDDGVGSVDEDDVVRLLIALILADHPVLEFGLSEIKSWEVVAQESAIRLTLKLNIGGGERVTQSLTFEVEDPTIVEDALRRQVVYALLAQGKVELARDLLKAGESTECPSAACDARLKSSRIRRMPAVVFVSDEAMGDQNTWADYRAAVVMTESSLYLFEGYSHNFGAYWRFEGDGEDNDGKPDFALTELTLKLHAPLWLYTKLLCDKGSRSQKIVKGSPALNLECSASIAEERLNVIADMGASCGVTFAMKLRLHVLAADIAVWLGQTLQAFISHVLLWFFIYLPSAYVVVNLLRHVDTATASVNQVAMISAYTYSPLLVFTDVTAMVLQFGLPSKTDLADTAGILPGLHSCLEHVLQAFWSQLSIYLLWTAYIFMLLRAKDEEAKCAAAAAARGRRMEQASTSYEDSFSGDPMCRICLGDEDDGRLISPCLCKGTMRFVHVECLTQWRTSSQNRESFFACDSCQYRYSFQRPAWASLLRSALVVHCVAFVLFILLICLCGHTANVADYLFFDGALSLYLGLSFEDEQMEEIMELYGDAYGGLFDSNLSVLGLNWIQLTTGAALVGIGGFVSSGFVTALFWGRRDNGIFLFAIIYGLVHSFMQVYSMVKDSSSAWLKLAESTVLDVGEGVRTNGYLATYGMSLYYRPGAAEPTLAKWYG